MINAVDPDSDDIRKIGDLPCHGRYSGRDDGLYDGLERGYGPYKAGIYTDLSRPYFVPDVGHIMNLPRMGRGVFPCLDHNTTDPFDDEPAIEKSLRDFPWHRTQVFDDDDNIEDGTEDVNNNGRIDGDNGDGVWASSEIWMELDPNLLDTDGDTFSDNNEKSWGYNPLSIDTDGDGINDNIEDSNGNGLKESTETNALNADSDNDGLSDKEELDGWNVIVLFGATLEEKIKYLVESNPNNPDTDGDGLLDLFEKRNLTDPTYDDTDDDGLTDKFEIENEVDSSPTIIDGNPPEIFDFNSWYNVAYNKYLGVKLPNGIQLSIKLSVRDCFGVNWINVDIDGLEDRKIHTNNATNVSVQFEWKVSGWDNIKKTIWEGFDINITALDKNNNFGFKEQNQPGIAKLIISALLGTLNSIATFIAELASGIISWIWRTLRNSVIFDFFEIIEKYISKGMNFIEYGLEWIYEKIHNIAEIIWSFLEPFIEKIAGICDDIKQFINSIVKTAFNAFHSLIEYTVDSINELIEEVKIIIKDIIVSVNSIVNKYIIGPINKIIGTISDFADLVIENITEAWNNAISFIKEICAGVKELTHHIKEWFKGNRSHPLFGINITIDVWCVISTLSLMIDVFNIGFALGAAIATAITGVGPIICILIAFAMYGIFIGDMVCFNYFWEMGDVGDDISVWGTPKDVEVDPILDAWKSETFWAGVIGPAAFGVLSFLLSLENIIMATGFLFVETIANVICGLIYQFGGNPVLYL